MQSLTILNTRDIKRIKGLLLAQFGCALHEDYAYFKNEKEKIFLVTKDIAKLNLRNLIIDKIGLYFAEDKGSEIRLSKEGTALLGRQARQQSQPLKNVVHLDKTELIEYFKGLDLQKDLGPENRLILLAYDSDIIGCSKYKMGTILNFLPKIHRGEVIV